MVNKKLQMVGFGFITTDLSYDITFVFNCIPCLVGLFSIANESYYNIMLCKYGSDVFFTLCQPRLNMKQICINKPLFVILCIGDINSNKTERPHTYTLFLTVIINLENDLLPMLHPYKCM